MSVPDKKVVVDTVTHKFRCSLTTISRKQIMFQGISDGKRIVICTPSSKIHANGKGWFDLTIKQVELLDEAVISILAVRLEGNMIYYIDFKELRKFMLPNLILTNTNEGEHWKLFIWDKYVQVQGNVNKFMMVPEQMV
ncbi:MULTISPECIES: hypothetical protein [Paenibacillus]|uniref:hypothetical protein n=1 Tax=Paenibacillus TaxID=44249 RepID=UPI00096EC4DB|nr:hypothetical protein [Paenibacillus odorifer]OME34933.1 hypothetical protein BSK58_24825 [Paenibacillus odorifer]